MKHNIVHITGIPEREEKEQGIENLFENIMMESFPNMMREKSHTSPRSTEGPNQDEPKEDYSKTHHN